jgi:hypothetical protein
MTRPVEEDIFRRALLGLLSPPSHIAALSRTMPGAPKKRLRLRKVPAGSRAAAAADEAIPFEAPPERIAIVEQLSSKTLSVFWSDSRSGHYADQVWRIGLARTNSLCVLTGRAIHPGDPVFRPRAYESYLPANRDRMILAAAVPSYAGNIPVD